MIEQRLARLEAIEAVRVLKARYCELCDSGYPADELAALFTEDALWDGGADLGRHEGREAIRSFFAGMPDTLAFAIHHVTNPQIEVDDDLTSAVGRWRLLQIARPAGGGASFWLAGEYHDRCSLDGQGWRFASVTLSVGLMEAVGPSR